MPALGLGTWKSAKGEVGQAVKEAVRAGYRHIDCAYIYLNEAEIGGALRDLMDEGTVKREDLWITSKLWNNRHARGQVEGALRQTLADLGLDYLDLYLIHWPVALREDVLYPEKGDDFVALEDLPLHETWKGMEDAASLGLARHIGVSNFSVKKLDNLIQSARTAPEMNQVECHPFFPQHDLFAFCRKHGIHLTAYSPLGSQDRSAAIKRPGEPSLLQNPVIGEIARNLGCTPAQVLLQWAMRRGMAVIPKSVNPGRIRENLAATEVGLSDADMEKISDLDRGFRYLDGSIWALPGSPYTLQGLWDE